MTVQRPLREPTLWFLLIASVVHVVRENWVDVGVFVGTIGLVLLSARLPGRDRPVPIGWLTPAVASAVCAGYALLLLPMARTGWPMRVAVAVPGVLALIVVVRAGRTFLADPPPGGRPLEGDEPAHRTAGRGWLVWVVLLVAGCLFQLYNFVNQPDPQTDSQAHPTLSALVDPLLADHAARAVAAAVWLAVGIWLVRVLTSGPARAAAP